MKRRKGYALATILILLGVALVGVTAIVSISTLESKISRSNSEGVKAYYITEAGIEDGFWRLNNTPAYTTALREGTLNVTYTATDVPTSGTGFTVTLTTSAKGAGYGTVDATGYSTNGNFTAKRHITADVFEGPVNTTIGTNAVFSGGSFSLDNGNAALTVRSGDLYSTGAITITQATVDLGDNTFETTGTYTNKNSTVTSGGIHASNTPPAATAIAAPGFDFTFYGTSPNYTVKYTPAQFNNVISSGGSTITFPGPVTYVNGDLILDAKDKTLDITGMLIINGSFSATGQSKDSSITVHDPGNGKSGIFVRTDIHAITGEWNIDGVVYSAGGIHMNGTPKITVTGGLVTGGDIQVNAKSPFKVTYDATRLIASLGAGAPVPIKVQHIEEQY